jgi:hypothetical protein
MIDLQNPKTRKALGYALLAIVVLGLTGVIAGPEIASILTALFGAAFGG